MQPVHTTPEMPAMENTRRHGALTRIALAATLGVTLGLGLVVAGSVTPASASGGPGTVKMISPLDSASGGPGTVFFIPADSASGGPGTV